MNSLSCLQRQSSHGVAVLIEIGQARESLKVGQGTLQPYYVLNLEADAVEAKMVGKSDTGERIEIVGALGNTYWGVAEDGTLYDLGDNSAVEYYHMFSAGEDSSSSGQLPAAVGPAGAIQLGSNGLAV